MENTGGYNRLLRFSDEEYQEYLIKKGDTAKKKTKKKKKYNNKKTFYNGITFDSMGECARYQELELLEKAGEIHSLETQPKFMLLEGFRLRGKSHRSIEYHADFKYYSNRHKSWVIEDFKSKPTKTRVYNMKKKMFLSRYGDEYVFIESFKNGEALF